MYSACILVNKQKSKNKFDNNVTLSCINFYYKKMNYQNLTEAYI